MRNSRRPRAHTPSTYDRPRSPVRKKTTKVQGSPSPLLLLLQRFILLTAAVVVVVGALVFVYYSFFLRAIWNEDTVKNIVIIPAHIDVSTDTILFASISYREQKLSLNSIPAEDAVEVSGGYGQYPLKSVYPLLGLDDTSHQTLVATYSYLIGVPIDEVWVTDDESVFSSKQSAGDFAQAVLFNKVDTNLGIKDRVKLYQFIQEQQPMLLAFNSLNEWQAKQSSRFAGQLKGCRVAIVNTTAIAGLGRKVSMVLERSGVVVVRLTDAAPTQPKSVLTIQPDQPDCVALSAHLQQLFPDEIEIKQDPGIMDRARSEAEVILGQDVGNFLGR